jgi:hypothetical protein
MIFGMTPFTFFHVVLSLVGIGSGLVVAWGLLKSRNMAGWTTTFLFTTIATSVTGFGFPFVQLLPSHILGIMSLVVLAVVLFALYGRHLAGAWRWIYVIGAVLALYFNCFVLVVQAFQKIPALQALAPTQSETPFVVVQAIVLLAFVALGIAATRRFHAGPVASTAPTGRGFA